MDFSYYKFQKFLLLFYLFLSNGTFTSGLHDFSTISGLLVLVQVSLGQGTVIKANSSRAFTSQDATELSRSKAVTRDPRILKDLSKLNRQGCLAKLLCGIEVARPPSDNYETTTMNDYAYLVKTFFDTFSFSGLTDFGSVNDENDDEPDPDPPKRERGDHKPSRKRTSSSAMAAKLYKEQSRIDEEENERIKNVYKGSTLEELLNEDDNYFGIGKRSGRNINGTKAAQIKNPRFDKSMYLDRKEREFSMATDENQKLTIAREVGTKFRRGRQCRALFNTNFSFCPWKAQDLQDILLNKTTYSSSMTTTTKKPLSLADAPYIYDSYAPLLEFQDDEYPNAFLNPETILVEAQALKTIPNGSEGKGFFTYDPTTGSNTVSYPARGTKRNKQPVEKKTKKKRKKASRESSEEVKDIDSSEISEKQNSYEEEGDYTESKTKQNSDEEEKYMDSNEYLEKQNSNGEEKYMDSSEYLTKQNSHDEEENEESTESESEPHSNQGSSSEEDTKNPVVGQDDEEDDYKSWSDDYDSIKPTTEKPKRRKTKGPIQKIHPGKYSSSKYSPTLDALKFTPTNIGQDYKAVSQKFAKPKDRVISQERYLSGLPSVWDPNREKWAYAMEKEDYQDEKDGEKSTESESSEEDEEDNEDNTKEFQEEKDNRRFPQRVQRVKPPRPLIRIRLPRFRGRRSIDYYTIPVNRRYLNLRPLPPEIFN